MDSGDTEITFLPDGFLSIYNRQEPNAVPTFVATILTDSFIAFVWLFYLISLYFC